MANSEFIEVASDKAYSEIKRINDEVLAMAKNVKVVNAELGKIGTPSGSSNATAKLVADLKKQEQTIISLQNKLNAAAQKQQQNAERTRLAEIKLQQQREKAFDRFDANIKKEEAALKRNESAYNIIQQRVNQITQTYNHLAAKKALGNNLTAAEIRLLSISEKQLSKYNGFLKTIDSNVGKYQRNVGNYASGWNGLSNSINQISRELPAFTFSMQTGFLALSNNIPILFDEINRTKEGIKAMRAEGQKVPSLFSQIASSVFSWGTALSILVTLTTVYGKEIGDFFSEMFKGQKAIDATKESMKGMADAIREGRKSATDELVALRSNLEIAKNVNLSYKEREIAVKNLVNQYPYYFEALTKEQIMAGETAQAERELTNALIARATAQAAMTKITENQSKVIDLREKLIDLEREYSSAVVRSSMANSKASQVDRTRGDGQAFAAVMAQGAVEEMRKKIAETEKEIKVTEAITERLIQYAIQNNTVAIGLDYKAEKTKKAREESRKNAKAIEIETQSLQGYLIRLKQEQALLSQMQSSSRSRGEFNMWQELIDNYQKAIDVIEKGFGDALQKDADKAIEAMSKLRMGLIAFGESGKLTREELELLQKSVNRFLDAFSDGFLADAGFKSLEIFTTLDEYGKSTFENLLTQAQETGQGFEVVFNSMAEVAQDTMNFINQAQQAQFEAQYARLEQEKRVALMFAGETATAREEIERQYDERRKAIARSQAEANKRNAVFNIAINTAQGITAALASIPPNVPLSIAIGLIGAIQAGIVASTPIPQFKDGGVHTAGGLMMVNDGGGDNYQEKVVTPDGKVHSPKGRNVIMNAPKGTQIFTHDQWQANLNGILAANDIGHSGVTIVNDGVTADEMRSIMRDALSGGSSIEIVEDFYGSRIYKRNNGRREEQMNARLRLTGRNVGRR